MLTPIPSTAMTQVNVSSNVTLTPNAIHFVDTSAARSLALPSPATTKTPIIIKDSTFSCQTNAITITQFGSEKIEGTATSWILQSNGGSWCIRTNGTDWFITPG